MPQLDQVTFFSQFFWLCFFFFGFYFLICKNFLPKMGRILKLRKKKMHFSAQEGAPLQQENEKVRGSAKAIVENGLIKSNTLLSLHVQRVESWLNQVVSNTNKKQLQNSNQLYLEWVGDNSIRQQIALQIAAPSITPRIFTSIFAEKCENGGKERKEQGSLFLQEGKKQSSGPSRSDSLDQPLAEKKKAQSSSSMRNTSTLKK